MARPAVQPACALLEANDAHPVDMFRRDPLGLSRALQPHARAWVVAVHPHLELQQLQHRALGRPRRLRAPVG